MLINSNSQASHIYQTQSNAPLTTTSSNTPVKNENTADKITISDAGLNAESKWQDIADKYDMTNISGNEVMEMAQELYENKLISSNQMLDMYTPPSIDFDLNKKVNYVTQVAKELESLKLHNDGSAQMRNAIAAKSRVVDIVGRIG